MAAPNLFFCIFRLRRDDNRWSIADPMRSTGVRAIMTTLSTDAVIRNNAAPMISGAARATKGNR